MATSKILQASWRTGVAVALLAAAPARETASAETIVAAPPSLSVSDAAMGERVFAHLRALQDIATANGGNRAAGTPGYDRSAEYMEERLKQAGYGVRFEEFEFPFFEERVPPVLVVTAPGGRPEPAPAAAFRTLSNSGSGNVMARLRAVNLRLGDEPPAASTSGCDKADFAGFERGAIALLRRGTCTFQVKVENAAGAGASGVVIMNEGTEGRKDAFSGQLSQAVGFPVVGVSYEFGRALEASAHAGATVGVEVNAVTGKRPTRNVLAEMPGKEALPLIMVGAHLDSVPEGPGINDNGSGSAAVLEAALELAPQLKEARLDMRFAFWGAEERGLIGSRHHVASLSEDERRRIGLYVNLDMVGSLNFVRYIQGATKDGASAAVRRELLADFREHNLAVEERDGGRTGTDDASFSQKEIPTLGLYTGAGGRKSEAQAATFGGSAGVSFDSCYHKACDSAENINRDVLRQNARALLRALNALAAASKS